MAVWFFVLIFLVVYTNSLVSKGLITTTFMKKIVITGSNGQLGSELRFLANNFASEYPFEFIFTNSTTLNITEPEVLESFFALHKPDYCINAAAYTAVDKAEDDKLLAYEVNVFGVAKLAKVCKKHLCKLIHISTDFVFGDKQNTPYTEDSPTEALGVYGTSKFLGEKEVFNNNPKSIIIRTAWLYSSFGNNFVKTMLKVAQNRKSLSVVYDQIGSPTYAYDLAETILKIVLHIENKGYFQDWGIYHYTNQGVASWYDFAIEIFEFAKIEIEVKPIRTAQYPTPAKRPAYSLLDKNKIKTVFELEIPYWKKSLQKCILKLKK